MPKFTIQIEATVVLSREITAESFEAAAKMGGEFAAYSGDEYLRPRSKSWTVEYGSDSKLIGVTA